MPLFNKLPHCDALFLRYFDRWYSPSAKECKVFPATRPDMVAFPELIGGSAADLCALPSNEAHRHMEQVGVMLDAAREDWPQYLSVQQPIDVRWVEAFDAFYNTKQVKALIKRSRPADFGNDYLIVACEFGAVLGHVLRSRLPRLEWVAGEPYWECSLFDPKSGNVIAVFHWAIKKLSGYGIDDGFVAKIRACVRVLEGAPPK